MTVAELRKELEKLPDDMIVGAYDAGGYLTTEFVSVDIMTTDEWGKPIDPPVAAIGGA